MNSIKKHLREHFANASVAKHLVAIGVVASNACFVLGFDYAALGSGIVATFIWIYEV